MQMRKKCWMLAAVLLVGCGKDKNVTQAAGFEHGLAVLNSDYKSTAITLVNPDTHAVIDPCLSSGSVTARLSQPLSGDVVLPSQTGTAGELAIIDRQNDAVIWLDAASCSVTRQLAVAPGFHGDPQDVAQISSTKAYVPRYLADDTGTGGNDVAIVDPSKPAVTGTLSMASYATDPNVLARPSHLVLAGELAFLTLNNINGDYSVYGPGRVLQIDTASDQVVGELDLPDARSCSGMALSGTWLAVGCDGAYMDANQATQSAVYLYDVTDTRHPTLQQTITAASLGQTFITSASLALHGNVPSFVATDANQITTVFNGTTALATSSSMALGSVAITAAGTWFVADATADNPAVIAQTAGGAAQRIDSAPTSLLPPVGLLLY